MPALSTFSSFTRRERVVHAVRYGRYKLFDNGRLYDLQTDPRELKNIAREYPDIAKRLGDEYLTRRVGQMFFGPDDVCDFELVIVDHGGQMIKTRAVGSLDDVVLLASPFEFDLTAHHVIDHN